MLSSFLGIPRWWPILWRKCCFLLIQPYLLWLILSFLSFCCAFEPICLNIFVGFGCFLWTGYYFLLLYSQLRIDNCDHLYLRNVLVLFCNDIWFNMNSKRESLFSGEKKEHIKLQNMFVLRSVHGLSPPNKKTYFNPPKLKPSTMKVTHFTIIFVKYLILRTSWSSYGWT